MRQENKTASPLVSIVMCTYNGEQHLREQLDSIVAQDYKNYELIIVDDCSTDGTWSILEKYVQEHPQINLYSNETNLGFKKNFEHALSKPNGELIALCDQDDVWFPNKISTLVREIGSNMLIHSNSLLIDEDGQSLNNDFHTYIRMNPHRKTSWQSLVFGNYVLGHNMLFRKELLKNALPLSEVFKEHDHWLAIHAASMGSVKYLSASLGLYRSHSANCTLNIKQRKKRGAADILRYITKRKHKFRRSLYEYKLQLQQISHILKIDSLTEDEKNNLRTIKKSYQDAFYSMGIKKPHLNRLLKKNPLYTNGRLDQKRYIQSICRSLLARVFR